MFQMINPASFSIATLYSSSPRDQLLLGPSARS